MVIEIPEFPTHLPKSDNKYAANKMQKLNNQAIYNGSLNRFGRAIVMNNMHKYLAGYLDPYLTTFSRESIEFPICVDIEVHTVINHGSIMMRKGNVCWKPPKPDYEPTWDIDNLASIWIKGLNDTLTKSKFIPDDTVKYLACTSYKYHEVASLEDRKLIIKINEDE